MRLLRKRAVADKTGLSGVSIDRREAAGEFPRRIRLGPNAVAWLEDEIEAWIDARAEERGPLPEPQGLQRARKSTTRRPHAAGDGAASRSTAGSS